MRYSIYLKNLGISRLDVFKMNHYGIRNEFEKLKYGTSCHEMWSLDTVLACEIYIRLKHLYEQYHYQDDFADRSLDYCEDDSKEFWERYDQIADERFKKVLYSLETIIKIYFEIEDEEFSKDMFENPNSQWNKVREGLKILGEGLWGVGI
jgi:hypothetical protein